MNKAFVMLVRILVILGACWLSMSMWPGSEHYAISPGHIWVVPLTPGEGILVDPNGGPEVTARWLSTENFRRTRKRGSRVPVNQTPGKGNIVS